MKLNYLSREGYEKLDQELRDLKTRGRKEIAKQIAEARAQGDLSENAEYDAAKEAQGLLEKRIAELEDSLAKSRIIDESEIDNSKVYILSTVTILNHKTGKEMNTRWFHLRKLISRKKRFQSIRLSVKRLWDTVWVIP